MNVSTQSAGIALVAPSGYPPDQDAVVRGIALLEAQGCLVHNYYDPSKKYQRFGGDDQGRVDQLMAAAYDPDVQVVMAVRGSYGLSRILPKLDFHRLAQSGKQFVGASDFTAFHLGMLAQAGAISYAGPMLCDDFTRDDLSEFTHRHFWQCLTQSDYTVSFESENNPEVNESGIFWGGNLAMVTHLMGTPWFPKIDGGILFVEDVNEHPYRIERMLLQLLHAGVLARQKALLLGDFSKYRLADYDNGYDFDAMLAFLRAALPIPVLSGLPFGHIKDKVTLPVGREVQLNSQDRMCSLLFKRA